MALTGRLQLELLDVYKSRLAENVDIRLRHQVLSDSRLARAVDASKQILVTSLHQAPQGLYRLEIDPPSYLPVSQFVNIESSGTTDRTIVFAVDPKKVKEVKFPKYSDLEPDAQTLLANSSRLSGPIGQAGEQLYSALDDIRRAGFLNIVAKAHRTRLSNDKTVLSYFQELLELRGDRFFAVVSQELRGETKNSVAEELFEPVSGALHHPPEGSTPAGSFKTLDGYGNLQLTFFAKQNELLADIDIDDARGLEHVFQVLRNSLSGRPTHPYDIHEILVYHQELDPGYRLIV